MNCKPKKQVMKNMLVSIIFKAFARAIRGVVSFDEFAKEYFNELPENFTFKLGIIDEKPSLVLSKRANQFKIIKSKKNKMEKYDLDIEFKNTNVILPLLFGKSGIIQAYAESRFILYGDIEYSMIITDIINLTETYLFPKFKLKNFMDKIPNKKQSKFRAYLSVILGIR